MTNIESDVFAPSDLAAAPWCARAGAFSPRSAFPGTGVPGGGGTAPFVVAPSVVVRSVPCVRDKVAPALPVPQAAPMAQLLQATNYNHMTSAYVIGEGASGPPPYREPV